MVARMFARRSFGFIVSGAVALGTLFGLGAADLPAAAEDDATVITGEVVFPSGYEITDPGSIVVADDVTDAVLASTDDDSIVFGDEDDSGEGPALPFTRDALRPRERRVRGHLHAVG